MKTSSVSSQLTKVIPWVLDKKTFEHRSTGQEAGNAAKRPRASKPKVKSGCITCKIRRVKCDEAKPQCLRCQKSGRTCDGYISTVTAPRGLAQLQPRTSVANLHQPSISIHFTEDENRYFQVFVDRAAHELSGYFDSEFWFNIVLQESHNVTAIRHAAIALGALNESLSRAPAPKLRVNVIQDFDKRHHEQAVLHYLMAIRTLNQYISVSPQLRTALIACVLFVCFETIQGSLVSTVQQTYGGLKLLRSYNEAKAKALPPPAKAGRQIREMIEDKKSDAEISSQIKDYFESGVFRERLPLPALHQEARTSHENQTGSIGQSSASTGTNRTLKLGQMDHANLINLTSPLFNSDLDYSIPLRKPSPIPAFSRSKKEIRQTQNVPTTLIAAPDASLEGPRTTSISAFPFEDTSSAYSSDSSSYRGLQPDSARRKSSLANTLSHIPREGAAVDMEPEGGIPSTKRLKSSPQILQRSIDVEDTIIQTLARLDGPGLFFGMPPAIPVLVWDVNEAWHLPIPTVFPSFSSAQFCWDFLMDRCLAFYRKTFFHRAFSPKKQESDEFIRKKYEGFMDQIVDFERAFKPILNEAVLPDGRVAHAPSLILSIYTKCTAMILSQTTTPNEMIYDTFFSTFQYVVHTCSLLISGEDKLPEQRPRNYRFSFNYGIIPALHFTATKCRDPWLRRQAVDLLFANPRQEGFWDSVLSARIGRWLIMCEEDGLDLPSFEKIDGRSEEIPPKDTKMGSEKVGTRVDSSPSKSLEEMTKKGGLERGREIFPAEDLPTSTWPRKDEGSASSALPQTMSLPQRIRIQDNIKPPETKEKAREEGSSPTTKDRNENERLIGVNWIVPERNRARLMTVTFHLPERYVEVNCQRVVADADGKKEERETVIAW